MYNITIKKLCWRQLKNYYADNTSAIINSSFKLIWELLQQSKELYNISPADCIYLRLWYFKELDFTRGRIFILALFLK